MNTEPLVLIAKRLMCCPTAPYYEAGVRAEAERICSEHGLDYAQDAYGNLIVRWQKVSRRRPLVLAAHLDHPGFHIVGSISPGQVRATFKGGVSEEYLRTGVPLRLMPGNYRAVLGKRLSSEKEFEIRFDTTVEPAPAFGVWDVEEFALRAGKIHGRVCDDLIGVAAILATLIELKQARAKVNVIGFLSRAEEVGFHGALAAAQSKQLPKNALIISLETSRELPPVKMGAGVIIRVGDRTSIFDSAATRFLTETAAELQKTVKAFAFQRALMSGGTCEATAFQEFGGQTAAVCVALGNYHNCASGKRIAAEFVSVTDALQMVKLLVAASRQMQHYDCLVARLPKRLMQLARVARTSLRKSS